MPTVANTTGRTVPAGPYWIPCLGCTRLFPAAPGQTRCPDCVLGGDIRCAAAHPDDPSRCDGPPDAVRVVDRTGAAASGCVHHGAVMLASIAAARVYPGSVDGAAIAAYNQAADLTPFAFLGPGGRGRS